MSTRPVNTPAAPPPATNGTAPERKPEHLLEALEFAAIKLSETEARIKRAANTGTDVDLARAKSEYDTDARILREVRSQVLGLLQGWKDVAAERDALVSLIREAFALLEPNADYWTDKGMNKEMQAATALAGVVATIQGRRVHDVYQEMAGRATDLQRLLLRLSDMETAAGINPPEFAKWGRACRVAKELCAQIAGVQS